MPISDWLLHRREIDSETGCWVWPGARLAFGHGHTRDGEGGVKLVHRLAYELFVGPIPEGMWVCHRCDNPPCFNPEHLFLGDPKTNSRDARDKGRLAPIRIPRSVRARGSEHGNAVFTEEKVLAIRADTRSQRLIALDFGVSESAICHIKARRSWSHI